MENVLEESCMCKSRTSERSREAAGVLWDATLKLTATATGVLINSHDE